MDQQNQQPDPKKKNWFSRHKIITTILAFFVLIIILGSLVPEENGNKNTNTASQSTASQNTNTPKSITIPSFVEYDDDVTADDAVQDIAQEDVSVPSDYTVVSDDNLNITSPVGSEAQVSEVIDGDTVRLSDGNKVRILGIDTPETKDPRKSVQCFGQEASTKMTELTEGKTVTLLIDSSQGDKDRYGRLLRYIYIGNTDIGAEMIKEGYAYAYLKYPVSRTDEYKILENQARENKKGLWAESTCNGSTEFPSQAETSESPIVDTETTTATNTNTNTEPAPVNTNTGLNIPPIQPSTNYSCDCSKTCGAMSSCEEAYYQLNTCGCSIRDNDKDGVPCESICSGG